MGATSARKFVPGIANRHAPRQPARPFDRLQLADLFQITDEEFRTRFRNTPLWRTRRRGILRNAAIVLGNQRDERAVDALITGLNDPEAIVRGASAWALRRIGGTTARKALDERLAIETDPEIRQEISPAN